MADDEISVPLAKLIALEFGYDAEWILTGKQAEGKEQDEQQITETK